MQSLHESLIRVLVTAETRAARAALKEFAGEVDATAAEVKAAGSKIDSTNESLDETGKAAQAAEGDVQGLGGTLSQFAGPAVIAGIAAVVFAFVELGKEIRNAKEALVESDFEDAMLDIGTSVHDAIDQIKFMGKVTEELDRKRGATAPQITADQLKTNQQEIKALLDYQKQLFEEDKKLQAQFAKGYDVEKQTIEITKEEFIVRQAITKAQQEQVLLNTKLATQQEEQVRLDRDKYDSIIKQIDATKALTAKANERPLTERVAAAKPGSDEQKLISDAIASAVSEGLRAQNPKIRAAYSDLAQALREELVKIANPDIHAFIRPDLADEGKTETTKQIDEAIDKIGHQSKLHPLQLTIAGFDQASVTAFYKEWQGIADEMNRIFAQGISRSLETLGSTIGKSIGSGVNPLKAAAKSMLDAIGSFVEEIGKALIEYGIIKTGLDRLFDVGSVLKIPGVAAIALGVAAEAAGALIKTLGGAHAFASGGIITGPTLGLIGEAGPEVVFPLSQLNRFVKNISSANDREIIVRGEIAGTTIKLLNARTNKSQNLVS